jgi:uncharacterized protein YaiE (UPF0345 family)
MSDGKSKVFDLVDPARRGFLKRLLAGAAFAVPVIATFSIDSLTLDSVHAMGGSNIVNTSNQVCRGDVGYVGPIQFQAHVSTGAIFSENETRVNGQVTLSVSKSSEIVNFINGEVFIVPGASILSVSISAGGPFGRPAAQVGTSGAFTIYSSNLDTRVMCDLDELVDFMGSGNASCTVTGEYNGRRFSASGQIYPAASPA